MTGLPTSYDLSQVLSGHVFAFMLIFARIAGVMSLFPGIGEPYVMMRARLMLALGISLLLLEPMLPRLPALPDQPFELMRLVIYELIVGTFFGTLLRMVNSALEAAGTIVGMATGLSSATMMNPALAAQSPLPTALLSTIGMVLIFLTGMDHFLIRSMIGLYDIFPPGGTFMPGDMAQVVMNVANRSYVLGVELAAPFLIMALLMNAAVGVLQRLLPQVQLFMIIMPLQIWGGLFVFSLTLTAIMTGWLSYFDNEVGTFFQQ